MLNEGKTWIHFFLDQKSPLQKMHTTLEYVPLISYLNKIFTFCGGKYVIKSRAKKF